MNGTSWVLDPPSTITTKRLLLRPFADDDAPAIAAHLDNLEISKWVTTMPHPYTVADAKWYLEHCSAPLRFAMTLHDTGELIGCVAIEGELGYWLAPNQWGKGIMKEATAALISCWFNHSDEPLPAGYFIENERSASVLYHQGFVDVDRTTAYCRALDREMPSQRLLLTKAAWQSRQSD